MFRNEKGLYECPVCGYPATAVTRTSSFPRHVERRRECLKCGHVHETLEMPVSVANLLRFAYEISVLPETAGAPSPGGEDE